MRRSCRLTDPPAEQRSDLLRFFIKFTADIAAKELPAQGNISESGQLFLSKEYNLVF